MCPFDVSTPTVEMMTVKMHLNSVISTKGAQYCTIDLKDFYLSTPMERPEYMRIKLRDLPQEFVDFKTSPRKWKRTSTCTSKYKRE